MPQESSAYRLVFRQKATRALQGAKVTNRILVFQSSPIPGCDMLVSYAWWGISRCKSYILDSMAGALNFSFSILGPVNFLFVILVKFRMTGYRWDTNSSLRGENRVRDPSLNPTSTALDTFSLWKICHITSSSQDIWYWHRELYIARMLNPCGSWRQRLPCVTGWHPKGHNRAVTSELEMRIGRCVILSLHNKYTICKPILLKGNLVFCYT